jgi:uncharacterized phage-associated protein
MKKVLGLLLAILIYCSGHIGISASLQEEDIGRINLSIQKAMDNDYDEEVILTLSEGARKEHPDCLLHYGEYLLHQENDVENAFMCLDKAAERGVTEAHTLISSVIGNWEESAIRRKNLFMEKWHGVFESNILVINPPEYTPDNIAEYFLKRNHEEEERDITPLKLQKMVYYAQACSLQAYKKPLFEESIESWEHGPVIKSLYNDYKEYGANIIQLRKHDLEKPFNFDRYTLHFLKSVYEVCVQYSASSLRKMTHDHKAPWSQVYEERANNVIPFLLMMHDQTNPVLEVLSSLKGEEEEYPHALVKRKKVEATQTEDQ